MGNPLAETLNGHLATRKWSFSRLAKAAGLPRNTVYRWNKGEVLQVHQWQHLAKAAHALGLDRPQTDALLAAGGQDSLEVLSRLVVDEVDRELLVHWAPSSLVSPPAPTGNLPHPLTSFIGRQGELEQITGLLATPSVRIVTLTGPGGSGKTRLAIESAEAILERFDGVFFVELATVRDPSLVILTIARTLGIRESQDVLPIQALAAHLQDTRTLLVLDNVEQVIEAAPLVANLLTATRGVKALVTSRTRLHVRGEHAVAVPPLALPGASADFAEFSRNPAVLLFADRASAVDVEFSLGPGNAPLVAEICARLDGLPLGIELAAARTRHLELRTMLEQFPGRLALANSGPRDLPDRQRTLQATIAWSHELLTKEGQGLFNLMGVFAGGFTSEAAEAVCGATGQMETPVSVGLESLVDESLVRQLRSGEGEPRYAMLETIREFALDRLAASGKTQAALVAHAGHFLALAERADLEGPGQGHWLPRLATEYENFRAALGWCRDHGQREMGLRLCIALMPLWRLRDRQTDARFWLETFMRANGTVSPGTRAKGLHWEGLLLMRGGGDLATAFRLFDESLALLRREGDLDGTSEVLQAVGDAHRQREEWGPAYRCYRESLELAERAGNPYLAAHGYMGLAICAQEEGQFEDAHRFWKLTKEWAERSENRASVALALNSLGEMARYREDWDEAAHYYEQTLKLAEEVGSEFRAAMALHNLGYVALYRGESDRATRLFSASLLSYEDQHFRKGEAECLAGLARVAAFAARLERAATLCGATEAILETLSTRLDTLDRADYERTLATLREGLGGRLHPLIDMGRAMSVEQAVEYGLTADSPRETGKEPRSQTKRSPAERKPFGEG